MGKVLLHELGKSLSYGRLSLKAKVLWPMLLATSDDQGRGVAEADAVKWYVCPNVPEITVEDVPLLLAEMAEQGMILLYDCERGLVYQVARWWEYQQLQWARPSKYTAPEGWTDRVRYSDRGAYHQGEGWDTPGGFIPEPSDNGPEDPGRKPPSKPPRKPATEPGRLPTQPNLTQPNSTELNSFEESGVANATARSPPTCWLEWRYALEESTNRPALVFWMFQVLYSAKELPSYGFIGKTARRMGKGRDGYERLMTLLWVHSARPPTGDVLAYVTAVHKGDRKGMDKHNRGGKTEYADSINR